MHGCLIFMTTFYFYLWLYVCCSDAYCTSFSQACWFCFFPQGGKMTFEQELYNNISIYLPRPYFITFAGDVSLLSRRFSQFIACVGYSGSASTRPWGMSDCRLWRQGWDCSQHYTSWKLGNLLAAWLMYSYPVLTYFVGSSVCACQQTCQVGLNFANEEESKRFHGHLVELIGRRQRKTGTNSLLLLSDLAINQKMTSLAHFDLVLENNLTFY